MDLTMLICPKKFDGLLSDAGNLNGKGQDKDLAAAMNTRPQSVSYYRQKMLERSHFNPNLHGLIRKALGVLVGREVTVADLEPQPELFPQDSPAEVSAEGGTTATGDDAS